MGKKQNTSKKPIYQDLAKYYDLLYSSKNYQAEARIIKSLIKQYKKSDGHSLLDVACGTGKHIPYLKDKYSILAVDLNKDMLTIARKNIPDVLFKQADMVNFDLKKSFDVIICLFGSIGYVKNYRNLNKVISNFANHLNQGGIVIIEPFVSEDDYDLNYMTGLPSVTTFEGDDITISLLTVFNKRGIISILDLHHLIAEPENKMKYAIEHHEIAMFNINKTLAIMKKHGLKAEYMPEGLVKDIGLYIGVKK